MRLKEIINLTELVKFSGNSKIERKSLFIGLVSFTILSRELFSKNEYIKDYANIFKGYSENKEPFRDYVFASRTQVLAKVQRIIIDEVTDEQLNEVIKMHINYVITRNKELKEKKNEEVLKLNKLKNEQKGSDKNSLIKEMYKNRVKRKQSDD